jgi:3-isopropylmalate/(R)-2-methylmalate dehydratase small subunit
MAITNLHNTPARSYLLGDDVNTDLHCSSKYLPGKSTEYIAGVAFEELSPGIAKIISGAGGGFLVAGHHFGINSSREQAVHVLRMMGVKGIVAKSFGRQFFRNAINNGLPVLECDTSSINDGDLLTVDFASGMVRTQNGSSIQGLSLPKEILSLIDAGGLIPFLKNNPLWNFA